MSDFAAQAKFMQTKLIKTEVPELLAKLVLNGCQEEALQLLIDWGTHVKDDEQVWAEAKKLLQTNQ